MPRCEGLKQLISQFSCRESTVSQPARRAVKNATVEKTRQAGLALSERAVDAAKQLKKLKKDVRFKIALKDISSPKKTIFSRRQHRHEFQSYADEKLPERLERMCQSLKNYAKNKGFPTAYDLQVFQIVLDPTSNWSANIELIRKDVNTHPGRSTAHEEFIRFVYCVLTPLVRDALMDFELRQAEKIEKSMYMNMYTEEDEAYFQQTECIFSQLLEYQREEPAYRCRLATIPEEKSSIDSNN